MSKGKILVVDDEPDIVEVVKTRLLLAGYEVLTARHGREALARSLKEKPDLVILDEFQRFKELLQPETEAGRLANELMSYPGVRVLLLSATPYKMLTLYDEEEDHYEDFVQTLRFEFFLNNKIFYKF